MIRTTAHVKLPRVFCLLIVCALCGCGSAERDARETAAQRECAVVMQRFRDPRNDGCLQAAFWSLCHSAESDGESDMVSAALDAARCLVDSNTPSASASVDVVRLCKERNAALLKSKDSVVRGYGAIVLGVIGDLSYTQDIAVLLQDTAVTRSSSNESERVFDRFDRSRAAMALGLLEARQYAPRLAELLRTSDRFDRIGAALGLGYMGAKEHTAHIAELIDDEALEVQEVAMKAIATLGGTNYAARIGDTLAVSYRDHAVACYALVRLGASDQEDKIAGLLRQQCRRGDAAKALALLGSTRYVSNIAELVDADAPLDTFANRDAMIALGVLGQTNYAAIIARHLDDSDTSVRMYAVGALLLMNEETYASRMCAVIDARRKAVEQQDGSTFPADTFSFEGLIKLHPIVRDMEDELAAKATAAYQKMRKKAVEADIEEGR